MPRSTVTPANARALAAELAPGEQVLWSAEPSPGMRLGPWALMIFAIPWLGGSLFFEAIVLSAALVAAPHDMPMSARIMSWVLPVFGLPFVLIGFAMIAQVFRMRRTADSTVFAMTDRRVVRIVRGTTADVSSIPLRVITTVDAQEYSDGSGTLTVTAMAPGPAGEPPQPLQYQIMGVNDIANARRVLQERIDLAVASHAG